ncbi:hypothetical protein [Microbulbifer spongiae]|uniref:Uncharacterized protein n=1 Tax=Microbulbifer spongiae TaxID=2944933 RepID=A0ABY9E907_9GAMM|nr:hypothetical protein [Microbulbifer sp. MI-G]WKD48812.1 hypothetical protein M8T91_12975 [Microbulbifer sp. MI-G]
MLNYASRTLEPIDKVIGHFWLFDLYVYGVEPHLLWETEQAPSIARSNMGRAKVTPWMYWLRPIGKLWRSAGQPYYLIRHDAFYPAQKPHRYRAHSENKNLTPASESSSASAPSVFAFSRT